MFRPRRQETRPVVTRQVKEPMDWGAVEAIAESVSAVAVVVSLVYLGIQIKQNTRSTRGATYESAVSTFINLIQPLALDADVAHSMEAITESWDDATPEERSRMIYMLFGIFKLFENMYYQHEQGNFDPELWTGWRNLMFAYYSRPGIRTWWLLRRDAFSAGFRDFLETNSADVQLPMPAQMVRGPAVAASGA